MDFEQKVKSLTKSLSQLGINEVIINQKEFSTDFKNWIETQIDQTTMTTVISKESQCVSNYSVINYCGIEFVLINT